MKMFEYYGNIHVYCPEVGAYEPLGPIFFSESLLLSYSPFPASFPHSNALATYVDLVVK